MYVFFLTLSLLCTQTQVPYIPTFTHVLINTRMPIHTFKGHSETAYLHLLSTCSLTCSVWRRGRHSKWSTIHCYFVDFSHLTPPPTHTQPPPTPLQVTPSQITHLLHHCHCWKQKRVCEVCVAAWKFGCLWNDLAVLKCSQEFVLKCVVFANAAVIYSVYILFRAFVMWQRDAVPLKCFLSH